MAWPRQAAPSNLYKEFIQKASRGYVDALQHEKPDVSLLVALYGKISRMRVISPPQVLAAAEQVLRRIVHVYFKPAVEFSSARVRSMLQDGSVDVLRRFSQCCRAECDMLGAEQL
jgi:hypothetical protein